MTNLIGWMVVPHNLEEGKTFSISREDACARFGPVMVVAVETILVLDHKISVNINFDDCIVFVGSAQNAIRLADNIRGAKSDIAIPIPE